MTPQELKNSILQLAIQGKLVEQRSEEGTAEELYKQIQAEKQALVKAGKIKKEKPLPEIIEDEIPFEIPESWMWVRLGVLVRVIGGVSYDKKDVSPSGYRILRGGNIQQMKVLLAEDDVFLPEQYRDDDKLIREGDVLIVASTGSKAVIGKAGYVDRPIHNTMIGAFLRICRPYQLPLVNYLRCLFDSDFYRKHIRELAQGTNINNVKESYITEFAIPLPPLAEQKRIVAKIEELLPLIERYEKAWSRLEDFNARFPVDMQKSILQMAIQGKLVEQRPEEGTGEELYRRIQAEKQALIKAGKIKKEKPLPEITEDEIPFEIPESWKWVRLGEIIMDVKDGPHFSPPYQQEGVPFVSTRNVSSGKLDLSTAKYISKELHEEFCKRVKPKKWDVLYTKGGTTGIAAVNDSDTEFSVWVHVAVLSLGSFIYPYYLAMALNSPHCYEQSQAFTHGTSNRDLGLTRMVKITLPLPPLAEQKRIVARLEELLPLCERLK